jgi:glycogen(starch) synthase
MENIKADYVFEVAYEVCNKVGGIYAVLESKTAQMVKHYGNKYLAVGFYNKDYADVEFRELEPDENIKKIFDELEKFGIKCHYGHWMKYGNPRTILIDSSGFMNERDRVKTELWEEYMVDSIQTDFDFDEPVMWSYAAGMLIEKLIKDGKCGVAQFHEWMSGAGLLYLENAKECDGLKIATVFTTHATMLGRSMAGSGLNLHEKIETDLAKGEIITIDSARRYGVVAKHTLENACAKNANVFTTVSETTARECEYIHGKKPDLVLPNGLDIEKFPHTDALSILRKEYWHKMKSFLTAYFSRYYDVDFSSSRVVYISGRYEFHNKGIDVFIRSLGKLNEKLKKDEQEGHKTYPVTAFIWIPTGIRGVNIQVLEDVTFYKEMKVHADEIMPDIKREILNAWACGKIPEKVLDENSLKISKKVIAHFKNKRGSTPRLCAFNLSYDEQNDMILNSLKENGLFNRKEDIVKVIFYPAYLSSTDGLVGLDYLNATIPCSLGVFPSYYEPWGYTPLEAAACGIPAVTTDLAGFGKFIKNKNGSNGIYVLEMGKGQDMVVDELTEIIYNNVTMPTNKLVDIRIKAKELAALCDWKILVKNYGEAHKMALEKIK